MLNISKIGYNKGIVSENNIISFIKKHAELTPERFAFVTTEGKILNHTTFEELWASIQQAASGLSDSGIGSGERVLIFLPMSVDMYIAMFATQMIGAIAVFLDSWARVEQLAYCANHAKPSAMIAPQKAFDYLSQVESISTIPIKILAGNKYDKIFKGLRFEALKESSVSANIQKVSMETTALITYTTGSSGNPKGADRTHRFLAAQHYALNQYIPYCEEDIDLPVFPIFSLNNIAAGVTTVLPNIDLANPKETDGEKLITQIKTLCVTCITLSPSLLRRVSTYGIKNNIKLPSIKRIATGGAPVSSDDVSAIKQVAPEAEIHILYGSTEVEPIAHLIAHEMPDETSDEGVCVGTVCKDLDFKLIHLKRSPITLDNQDSWDDLEVTNGEVGELIVSGEHVCRSYYKDEEAFKKSKIIDSESTIWHRTGDLCKLDLNKQLWVVGRLHNTIIRQDIALFPVKAEVLLKQVDGVLAGAYLGIPDQTLGEKAVVAVSLKNNSDDSIPIINKVSSHLKQHDIVFDDIVIVDHIPMDPRHHSKVEYATLREQIVSKQSFGLIDD